MIVRDTQFNTRPMLLSTCDRCCTFPLTKSPKLSLQQAGFLWILHYCSFFIAFRLRRFLRFSLRQKDLDQGERKRASPKILAFSCWCRRLRGHSSQLISRNAPKRCSHFQDSKGSDRPCCSISGQGDEERSRQLH